MKNILIASIFLISLSACREERENKLPYFLSGTYNIEKYENYMYDAKTGGFSSLQIKEENSGFIVFTFTSTINGSATGQNLVTHWNANTVADFFAAFAHGINTNGDIGWELDPYGGTQITLWQEQSGGNINAAIYQLKKSGKNIQLESVYTLGNSKYKEIFYLKERY